MHSELHALCGQLRSQTDLLRNLQESSAPASHAQQAEANSSYRLASILSKAENLLCTGRLRD